MRIFRYTRHIQEHLFYTLMVLHNNAFDYRTYITLHYIHIHDISYMALSHTEVSQRIELNLLYREKRQKKIEKFPHSHGWNRQNQKKKKKIQTVTATASSTVALAVQ